MVGNNNDEENGGNVSENPSITSVTKPSFEEFKEEVGDHSDKQRYVNSFSNRKGINFEDLGIISKEDIERLKALGIKVEENTENDDFQTSADDGNDDFQKGGSDEFPNENKEDESKENIIPGGTRTGNMLHEIFEQINFENIMSEGVYGNWKKLQESESNDKQIIESVCKKYFLKDEYRENVYKMVWNTLHTPIIGSFRIGDIKKSFKEIPFELKVKNKYLKGIIDMIFEYNGNIYILDWKSNKTNDGNYSKENVQNLINEGDYFLQYSLYKAAVNDWLKLNGIEKEVTGGFYVFLRKGEMEEKSQAAVYEFDME